MLRSERETIVRWDEEERSLVIYTASPSQAARLGKRGYLLEPISSREGKVTGWEGRAPEGAITFRTLVSGRLRSRPGPKHGFSRRAAPSQ